MPILSRNKIARKPSGVLQFAFEIIESVNVKLDAGKYILCLVFKAYLFAPLKLLLLQGELVGDLEKYDFLCQKRPAHLEDTCPARACFRLAELSVTGPGLLNW